MMHEHSSLIADGSLMGTFISCISVLQQCKESYNAALAKLMHGKVLNINKKLFLS